METNIEEIAAQIVVGNRLGFGEGRAAVYGWLEDVVEIVHVPRFPSDGSRTKEQFKSLGEQEDAAYKRSMSDFHQEDVQATIEGDQIVLERTMCGTLPNGDAFRVPLRNVYTVKAGKIQRIEPHVSPNHQVEIREALSLAEFDASFIPGK